MVQRRKLLQSIAGGVFGTGVFHSLNTRFGSREDVNASEQPSGDYLVEINSLSYPTVENDEIQHDRREKSFTVTREEYWSKRDKQTNRNILGFHHVFTDVENSEFCERVLDELLTEEVEEELLTLINLAQSIRYSPDYQSTQHNDYTRYPSETFVDWRGDCKDTTVLFHGLASTAGYDVGYAIYPTHVTPTVRSELVDSALYDDKLTFIQDGTEYLPIETTNMRINDFEGDPEQLMFTYMNDFTVFEPSHVVTHSIEAVQRHMKSVGL